jgi:hypothetical protein
MLNCLAARVTRGTEVPSPRARAAAEIVSISLIVPASQPQLSEGRTRSIPK